MADPMQVIAERNLRSYVERHVPEGPDRQAALRCIETLAGLRAAPEGFVLVPVEPTQEMLDMVCTADGFEPWTDNTMGDVYRTMLAARPQGVKDGR